MPKFLEDKLKKEYPGNDAAVYGTLNNLGYMHGNVETPAGAAAQQKHDRDVKKKSGIRKIRVRRNRNLIPI